MGIDKLTPHDPRVRYLTAPARGKTYGYLLADPADAPIDTILLLHGFPDLSFGWRYQIPHLVSLGYRVVAPDAVGYASTDAAQELEAYTTASPADDIAGLAQRVVSPGAAVIVGGHDMGGETCWQVAARHPQLVKAVFSVCTPVLEVGDTHTPLEDLIAAGKWTHFGYQLQLIGPAALNWAAGAAQKDKAVRIRMPALFIAAAAEDGAVPPSLAEGMGKIVLDLTSGLVQAGHWALWQAPAAINETLEGWLNSVAQKT
ncbi:epoxide hydrolase [Akanthomyces lecanii RCEF 1005]|uniref:Epoxide hydrolase n=1 Tax=Akanthomyces lecanii RCEF 1005 TaxID=1081108 RepID=A0A162KNH4_CORDF|nr:epoxide hydrolase [Akanthomyces lecanii RCEF 1005]